MKRKYRESSASACLFVCLFVCFFGFWKELRGLQVASDRLSGCTGFLF